MDVEDNDVILYKETNVQDQTGTLLTSIPKEYCEKINLKKSSKLQWKLKTREDGKYYLVCWNKED